VPVRDLADVLRVADRQQATGPIVVLADTTHRHGFRIDRLMGYRDVVLSGLSAVVAHLPVVAGASVEPDGSVLVVLDPPGLIQQARRGARPAGARTEPPRMHTANRILVVDDAMTVRELQRSILEQAGFEVTVASDGLQALSSLAERPSDLVLTDIEMPNMDGFALTEAIRAHPSLANTPVLILSSRGTDEDRQRGLDAGADAYIVKSRFDQSGLLAAVNRLLGPRQGGVSSSASA
jgi:two-component system chemotaxis sensor kinase CheA